MGPSRLGVPVIVTLSLFTHGALNAPAGNNSDAQKLANPNYGPIPGQSTLYSDYRGISPPFPANITAPIYPTIQGSPADDDVIWQNLLAAEWVIFNFYQQGVETFNASAFVAAGFPNTTYDRVQEIRDNEAGHLRIFQNQISPTSLKPGACRYEFPFADAATFLELQLLIEISSMAFLSGLVQEPKSPASRGAMLAISDVETRHGAWSLMEIWGASPFAGPSDTVFPYAEEILQTTNEFVVPGSCPAANPPYPEPDQVLPPLRVAGGGTTNSSIAPGATVGLNFTDPVNQPAIDEGGSYFAVFFHGVGNVSVPLDVAGWPQREIKVTVPDLEQRGVFVVVIANQSGAPNLSSVIAGPDIWLQQPEQIGVGLA